MKSFFSYRVSKFNALMTLCALGVTTFSYPAMAAPQEVCIRTATGNVACGMPVSKPPKSSQPAIETTIDSQTEYGVKWELKSCVRGAKNLVSCTLVLSSEADRGFSLNAAEYTKLVDSSGSEYSANKIQIGKRVDRSSVAINMAKGASYRTIITFADIPDSISQVVLFKVSYSNTYASFRNVPIN